MEAPRPQPQGGSPTAALNDSSPLLFPGKEADSRRPLCLPTVVPVPGSHLDDDLDLVIWLNMPQNDPGAASNAVSSWGPGLVIRSLRIEGGSGGQHV